MRWGKEGGSGDSWHGDLSSWPLSLHCSLVYELSSPYLGNRSELRDNARHVSNVDHEQHESPNRNVNDAAAVGPRKNPHHPTRKPATESQGTFWEVGILFPFFPNPRAPYVGHSDTSTRGLLKQAPSARRERT